MSQIGKLDVFYIPAGTTVRTLTGNSGGAVAPSLLDNIDILGASGISVVGSSALNKLTISMADNVAINFVTSSGTAIPAANTININGSTNIATTGGGAAVLITLKPTVTNLTTVESLMFDTHVATAGVTLSGTSLEAYGTNPNVDINLTPQGTGTIVAGGIYATAPSATAKLAIIGSDNKLGGLAGTAGQILQGGATPAYSTTTYPADVTKGDLLSATADHIISTLAKDTNATRYLANTGVDNVAKWDQVNLTNGVTGTLPIGNGGTGITSAAKGALLVATDTNVIGQLGSTGTSGQHLTSGGAATVPAWSTTTYADTIAKGALVVATAANTIGSLASTGLAGQHLTSGGAATVPAFSTTTYADTIAKGAIVVATDANQIGSLASTGTSGQLLASGGAATVPAFTTTTYPLTTTKGDVLVASADNTIGVVSGATTAGYALIANGAGTAPTFQAIPSSATPITDVTGTSQALTTSAEYTANNASLVTFTLPATAAYGTRYRIYGKGAGGWKIAQNAGQQIIIYGVTTTAGASGYIASSAQYDDVEVICITADTTWKAVSIGNNITYA